MLSSRSGERRAMRPAAGLMVSVRPDDGPTGVMRLTGEFDLSGRTRFATTVGQLVAARYGRIRADAAQVTFIDSYGLLALLAAHSSTRALGIDFRMQPVSHRVRRAIELAGVGDVLLDE